MKSGLSFGEIVLDPILPLSLVVLLALLLGGLTVYVYWQTGTRLSRGRNLVLTVSRLLGICLLLLILSQPSRMEKVAPPSINKVTVVALDTSRSMKQADVEKKSRLETAKNLLYDSDIIPRTGAIADPKLPLFEFSEDAKPVSTALSDIEAKGTSTRIHQSIVNVLNSFSGSEQPRALILMTDGHDFELVNAAKTGFIARQRHVPIFAVAFGKQGKVRDVSARITNFQPYCYVKQKARISASLRLLGCEFEEIQVQLLRQGKVVQTKRLNADENSTLAVQFEVTEPEVGQYEYEVRAVPLQGELDVANNSAITYLNVIDQQIQILVLEGAPYWDTTFLQRSLMRNDKMEVDSVIQYTSSKARLIREKPGTEELKLPETVEQFNHYDIIVVGKSIDKLLKRSQLEALQQYVRERGGTVIFSRGKAFEGDLASNEIEPMLWQATKIEKPQLQISREGQSLAPFRTLTEQSGGLDNLPELIAARNAGEKKSLSATLAFAKNRDDGGMIPAMIHRHYGEGQVLSVGVEGLWRWAFNAKSEAANNAFDRFWDQMVLWLMAARDFTPAKQFSFRTSSANILLGEKVHFRFIMRKPDPSVQKVPLTIFYDQKEVAKSSFVSGTDDPLRLTSEFLPDKLGKYRAIATFPDGTQQESRFIVFDENMEETEVATDTGYLKKLCETSGGRLLEPRELGKLISELRDEKSDDVPRTRMVTVWDQTWYFYLIGLWFGVDWYLRRKWGLC